MTAKLIWITPDAEKIIAYCARVSNPQNQDNENYAGLLRYCIRHGHWSIFEMASMCVEINTTRDISAQMLRHRSFSFQEFSQRYAEAQTIDYANPRRQDTKNRQNSFDDVSPQDSHWFISRFAEISTEIQEFYNEALAKGIAKESARKILPLNTQTKLYMSGTIRSWIHYLQLRTDEATQLEHREIANKIEKIFAEQLPVVYTAIKGE